MKTIKTLYIIGLISFLGLGANAQSYLEAGTGFGSGATSPVVSFHKDWTFGAKKKFVVGTGVRYTGFFGKNTYFTSAPNELAIEPKSVDSLLAPTPALHSLNLLINLGFNITEKLQVGFNIDAAGFSFGPEGTPSYIRNGKSAITKAAPTGLNLLLVGNNDKGSLNSNFYGKYKFNEKWGVKLAFSYLFNELTTTTKVQTIPIANDRFRAKSNLVFVGLDYHF